MSPVTKLSTHSSKYSSSLEKYPVGSLNWLGVSTRPDIVTITNLLAHYMHSATSSHVTDTKYVLHYLKGTSQMEIRFSSRESSKASAFVQFFLSLSTMIPFTDANWGPQDTSMPYPNRTYENLELFKSQSLSGFIMWLGGGGTLGI